MGLWGHDTVWEGTFLGVLNVSLCALGAHLRLDMFARTQCFCVLDFHQISWSDDHRNLNLRIFALFLSVLSCPIITLHNVCQICTSGPIIGNK